MRFTPESNFHPNVPPQHRCVWMSAGILSYQLCDRSFDCDRCPLDAAMRMHFSRKDVQEHAPAPEERTSEARYSPNHCWIAQTDHAEARIGIEPTLASLLVAKEIVLPSVGDVVTRDAYCCWIIMEGGTFHITAPVSGTVSAVNGAVASDPALLGNAAMTHGWLYEIRTRSDHATGHGLLAKPAADARYREDQDRFTGMVRDALAKEKGRVGVTLADGGLMLKDVASMLGAKRYFELVEAVYGARKQVS
jgi:glycine cleavage system H protein